MKSRLVVKVLLGVVFLATAQNDWQWQHPLPQSNVVFDVEYIGQSNLVAVGAEGCGIFTGRQ